MKKKIKRNWTPEEEAAYQKLKEDISKIIERAEKKGIPIRNVRDNLLHCQSCRTYEDVLFGDGKRRTFLKSGVETNREFIVLDHRERRREKGRIVHFTTTYRYVCGVCGVHQSSRFTSDFSLD